MDTAIARSPTIAATAGGVAMTYWAAVSSQLNPYGPVAWGAVGITSGFVLSGMWALGSWARKNAAMRHFAERRADAATGVNPLADHFYRQRIVLSEFFHPFYQSIVGAKFQDCELLGPAAIFMTGCRSVGPPVEMHQCETVIVKPLANVFGATVLDGCTFERCKFFRVTFLLFKSEYLRFLAAGGAPPVISDGTAGDL